MAPDVTVTTAEFASVIVHTVCGNRFSQNCFIVASKKSARSVVIDPGYGYSHIRQTLESNAITPETILATHAHFDHIASIASIQEDFGGPEFLYHHADASILASVNTYTLFLKAEKVRLPHCGGSLADDDVIRLDSLQIKVHHAPGHTPGGCIFELENAIFTGDLFIGLPDKQNKLPGLQLAELKESRQKIFNQFAPETIVFSGHGKVRTLGDLKKRLSAPTVA